jgi:hypothetical protein
MLQKRILVILRVPKSLLDSRSMVARAKMLIDFRSSLPRWLLERYATGEKQKIRSSELTIKVLLERVCDYFNIG